MLPAMAKFTDKQNREWQLQINVAAMRRAKSAGVDLSMPVTQLREFIMDDVFLADCLWSIVSANASERNVNQDQFDAGFTGPVFEAARTALWEALEEYWDPKSQRSAMLRTALAETAKEMAKAMNTLDGSTNAKES